METLANWFGPLHPPVTHFPIVCSILALLAFGVGSARKTDWLLKSAGALWLLAFLTAIPSVLLGHLFAHNLGMYPGWTLLPPDSVLKGQLRFHAILGTVGLAVSFFTTWGAVRLLRSKPCSVKVNLPLGLAVALLFGAAGHEGGEMTYGTEPPASSPSADSGDLLRFLQDYRQNLVKMNLKPWNSRTHGHRWVNTYVSKDSVQAYKNSETLPEGTVIVKESYEDAGGEPSQAPGPLYLMVKGKVSDFPKTGGWQYALTWENPATGNPEKIQGPVTWLPGEPHLNSCMKCHGHFKGQDYLGGVPEGNEVP